MYICVSADNSKSTIYGNSIPMKDLTLNSIFLFIQVRQRVPRPIWINFLIIYIYTTS